MHRRNLFAVAIAKEVLSGAYFTSAPKAHDLSLGSPDACQARQLSRSRTAGVIDENRGDA